MHIKDMQWQAWENSETKGFHKKDEGQHAEYVIFTKLMLIVGELAEGSEETREGRPLLWHRESDGKPEGIAAELADAVIRIADLAQMLGFELEKVIEMKMAYNAGRPHMHGGKKL